MTWMTPETFRSIRKAAGLSANELAKKLRVADGRTVRHWEAGDRPVTGPVSLAMLAIARDVGNGWEPIETAPKDGTEIFVWGSLEACAHARPHIGCEDIERVFWYSEYESWCVFSTQCEGWVPEPTHWQPLPPPPEMIADERLK